MICDDPIAADGRRFGIVATARLAVSRPDWPHLRAILAEAALRQGWSLRDSPQSAALCGSLVRKGASVAYRQWAWTAPPEPAATLYVVAPRDDDAWRPPTGVLFRSLAREWPGALAVSEGVAR